MMRLLLLVAAACLGLSALAPTPALADTPLDPPTRLQAVHVADVSADLSWVSSGLAAQNVVQRQVDGAWKEYARVQTGMLALTGLTPGTTFTFRVYSLPFAGTGHTASAPTAPVSFTTLPGPDTVPPSPPPAPMFGNVTTTRATVSWAEATDNVQVTGYHLQQLTSSGWTTVRTVGPADRAQSFTGLTPATSYTFAVLAFDARSNVSARSAPATMTTLANTAEPTCRAQVVTFAPGFQVNVTVTNTTPATMDGWTIRFTLPATATVSSSFGGVLTREGAAGTITPQAWNRQIGPGAQLSVGFSGSAAPFTPPSGFSLNGLPCSTG